MDTTLNKIDRLHKTHVNDRIMEKERERKGVYEKYLLPRIIHFVCGLSPMMQQRQRTVPLATGRVLERGIG